MSRVSDDYVELKLYVFRIMELKNGYGCMLHAFISQLDYIAVVIAMVIAIVTA